VGRSRKVGGAETTEDWEKEIVSQPTGVGSARVKALAQISSQQKGQITGWTAYVISSG